jgi:hypothetical protein
LITIYKEKKDIPNDMEYVELNDVFFNKKTVLSLDERAKKIIKQIDEAQMVGKYKIKSKFNGVVLDIDRLSTGCKTVLNVLYFPDKVFCMKECGDNALEVLYNLENGFVYNEYAIIPFNMKKVEVISELKKAVIDDYEELKEWWEHEE